MQEFKRVFDEKINFLTGRFQTVLNYICLLNFKKYQALAE
jgi:hypothetical protein